ncbi:ParM/StbA family protein [Clostridium botulinum]|uniref:ParM/StbA family protein n=1 Tax=Clostridium botulinum TaxID=1491 RepID=UPI000772E710|nr:ParM/StbA family protein [Clostridium botulinum]NFH80310.1 ParM/StbA family protein [Clostridium botulinum]NFH83725.1 ParM/StbA family protein [Clostridium botulinum]NFI11798.1 ParM/StbA family protein [Clostridium botulinum]NFI16234.1 ParM/StbA family protein [Clostridium botulinum]NFO84249.1 ParM/StbA family protein [Clostridium botulinum]
MILGVDIGTYSVKTSTKVTFFSKFTQEESFTEINKININGSSYNIGEGEFSTDWDKSRKGNTLILLYSALYKSTEDNINQVVLGLPVQQYKKNKNNLIELIENNKCAKVENRNLIITDVTVAPEGASSYYSIDGSLREEIGNKQLIIIDIGGRTTDIIVFQNKIIIDVKTIPIGMLNIYQEIIDTVNTKYTESLVLEDGEGILKDGLFLKGKQQDINFVQPILKRNFNSVFKEIQLKYNTNKGYVYLTGGGSILLKLPFKNRLSNLIISNNPIFDNAIGFGKVGESLWLE